VGDLANKDKTVALSIVLDIVEMAYQGADLYKFECLDN
jgi:hypothetical protein